MLALVQVAYPFPDHILKYMYSSIQLSSISLTKLFIILLSHFDSRLSHSFASHTVSNTTEVRNSDNYNLLPAFLAPVDSLGPPFYT
jgi:hypothetical protein